MSNKVHLLPGIRKLLERGIRHHKAGRTRMAEACYRKVLRVDPLCAEALLCRGLVAQEGGQYAESVEWLNKALALKPDEPVWMNNLAHSYLRQGETEKARDIYRRVLDLSPDNARAHYGLGTAQQLLMEWDAAEDSYRRAVALQPDAPDYHCGLARFLREMKALDESVEEYNRVLVLDPNHHEACNE